MPEIPVFDHDTVLSAIAPAEAIERVRDAFVRALRNAKAREEVWGLLDETTH